jgi:hypothetical protein
MDAKFEHARGARIGPVEDTVLRLLADARVSSTLERVVAAAPRCARGSSSRPRGNSTFRP